MFKSILSLMSFEYGKVLKENGTKVALGTIMLGLSSIAVTAAVRAARKHTQKLERAATGQADVSVLASDIYSPEESRKLLRATAGVVWLEPKAEDLSERLELGADDTVWALKELQAHQLVELDDEGCYRPTPDLAIAIQDGAMNARNQPELVAVITELETLSGSS